MYMFHRSFSDGKPINLPESVAKKSSDPDTMVRSHRSSRWSTA